MSEPLWGLLAAIAGGVGAVMRFALDAAITARAARAARRGRGTRFPWGIVAVNISGSFAMGVLTGVVAPSHPAVLVLGVGLLGGYTTFSAASFDTIRLLQRGRIAAACGNSLGQLAAAVAAAAAGFWVATLF